MDWRGERTAARAAAAGLEDAARGAAVSMICCMLGECAGRLGRRSAVVREISIRLETEGVCVRWVTS